jgi:branched-chain amino acid transport system ATP-binding protein
MSRDAVFLSVKGLRVSYDAIQAVREVSFEIRQGEIATLIGGNGAGKSSILRAVSGLIPYQGDVVFEGRDLRRVSPDKIVGLGIAHVPEGRGIFGNLTVLENLKLATWRRRDKAEVLADFDRVFGIFPKLKERRSQQGGTLSGGEQQMLAVGRALMSRGRMMLLDEPSMGLSPLMVQEIFRVIVDINKTGTTILLVEQNAHMALKVATSAHVLETGSIILSGTGKDLMGDERVKEAYLGG